MTSPLCTSTLHAMGSLVLIGRLGQRHDEIKTTAHIKWTAYTKSKPRSYKLFWRMRQMSNSYWTVLIIHPWQCISKLTSALSFGLVIYATITPGS